MHTIKLCTIKLHTIRSYELTDNSDNMVNCLTLKISQKVLAIISHMVYHVLTTKQRQPDGITVK